MGDDRDAKSISHEHTFNEDTAAVEALEATLARLSEMVGRRLREQHFHARTIQLKLRYSDFSTITRAHTLDHATQLDNEIYQQARALMQRHRRPGAAIRLLGVHASGLGAMEGQMNLLEEQATERWRKALSAADQMRDRFGEDSVSLAAGLKRHFRERIHDNIKFRDGKA